MHYVYRFARSALTDRNIKSPREIGTTDLPNKPRIPADNRLGAGVREADVEPCLDRHVAEIAARVPVNMKVKGIREKHVLREAAKDVLIPKCMTARSIRHHASDTQQERPD